MNHLSAQDHLKWKVPFNRSLRFGHVFAILHHFKVYISEGWKH